MRSLDRLTDDHTRSHESQPRLSTPFQTVDGHEPRLRTPALAPPPAEAEASVATPAPEPPKSAPPLTHGRHHDYRTPQGLGRTPLSAMRALIIGPCHSVPLPLYLTFVFPQITADHILYSQGSLPSEPPSPLDDYDFQVIMPSLRAILIDHYLLRLNYDDLAAYEAAYEDAKARLVMILQDAFAYRERRHLPTFVSNFTLPQQNLIGRMMPRYDVRNIVHFVERLNRVIADEIGRLKDVYLLDIDQISASFGRKYIQDDQLLISNHHSYLDDFENQFDQTRLVVPHPFSHDNVVRSDEFLIGVCHELHAMVRTLRQMDQVKLVIVDLDDTLWRGLVAEEGAERPWVTDGWPLGLVEALTWLRRRGVLLAIASKNDEERIRSLWPSLYGGRLELSNFVSVKINWEPKTSNIEQILAETNLLPRSVVFIDDNPVEREAVAQAFPDLRVLGTDLYKLRSLLLWAPEMQPTTITAESARRTEMVQAQVERENSRRRLTREEFLASLSIKLRLFPIKDITDERFARAFELINKSNQFNTTGRRWTSQEAQTAFATGIVFWAFDVEDRFTRYGLVGVAIVRGSHIEQFVMSCRVVGLEVELAVLSALTAGLPDPLSGVYVATDSNHLCRDLYARCGFEESEHGWLRPVGTRLAIPAHFVLVGGLVTD
jgi:FkbH-like protein